MRLLIIFVTFFIPTLTFSAISDSPIVNINDEIKLVPQLVDQRIEGFKVISVISSSVYSEIGYKKGDIIKNIDGKPVFTPNMLKDGLILEANNWKNLNASSSFEGTEDPFLDKSFEELENEIRNAPLNYDDVEPISTQ